MTSQIALLGWGSLLWEGRKPFDNLHGRWRYDGPVLKVEFSRISQRRAGALTLVIDPENGALVRAAWCLSYRQTIDQAIEDLRQREGTSAQNVGSVALNCRTRCRDEETRQTIQTWAAKRGLSFVVWTDLRSNFAERTREMFSVEAAMRYLERLKDESATKAVEYIQRAPAFVRTPFRDAYQIGITPSKSSKT